MLSSEEVAGISIGLYSVMILVMVVTIMKLIRSGEYRECKRIIFFFIISNTGAIIATSTNIVLYKKETSANHFTLLVVVNSFGYLAFQFFSTVGHWLFSFEYYNMVCMIKF